MGDASGELLVQFHIKTEASFLSLLWSVYTSNHGRAIPSASGHYAAAHTVGEAKQIFAQVNTAIQSIIEKIGGISQAMTEVMTSKDDVLGYMNNVSAVTEEVSSSAEEIAATSEEQTASVNEVAQAAQGLKQLAEELQEMLSFFRNMEI